MVCRTAYPNGATPVGTYVCVYVSASPTSTGGNGVILSYNGNSYYTVKMIGYDIPAEVPYYYIFLGSCSICNLTCSSADYSIPVFGCANKAKTWIIGALVAIGGYNLLKRK